MNNSDVDYWVVKLQTKNIGIGIISFIKRDHLEHYDIGFAFLSEYTKNGYAYEAAKIVLHDAKNNSNHEHILATTVKENANSIKLLEKLGFRFDKEIENGKNLLLIYRI